MWLEPYSLADRLVTCGEYAKFMADGGYRRAEFWLSDGWMAVNNNRWRAPLYWSSEQRRLESLRPCAANSLCRACKTRR